MKATGIVRRIDDLGRVVIPKEIRRTLRIREGDPLEIFTGNDGEVVFKKYSPMGEMAAFVADYATALATSTQFAVLICDREHCIAAAGISKNGSIEKVITADLENILEMRKTFINQNDKTFFAIEGCDKNVCVAVPIISAGDITGSVVLLENNGIDSPSDTDIKLAEVAGKFLGTRFE